MKTSYKYIAIAFATILCSCNEEVTPDMVESQVEISANIIPSVQSRVSEDGKYFTDGDAIKVQNVNRTTKNHATYTYSQSESKWSITGEDKLYWGVQSANTFNAWYPATAAYDSFTIPADQSTAVKLASADWMTATTTARRNSTVALSFNHNLAKVTVTIEEWSNKYLENEKVISSLELNSLSSAMPNNNNNNNTWVKAYEKEENKSFVAIIAPGNYSAAEKIMQVYVKDSSIPLAVKTSEALTLEASKAYRFNVTVGKDLATITSSVTVGNWGDVELENQNATQQ